MDEQLVAPVEQPGGEPPVEIEAPLSIAEHAAQYDPHRDKTKDPAPEEPLTPLAADATAEQKAAHHSEQQRREKSGEFKTGKKRHRAASQQATSADAPRIQELTRQINELKGQLAQPRQQPVQQIAPHVPQAPPQQAAPPVQQTQSGQRWIGDPRNDPEPQEADYGGDPMKYLSARFQWEARGVNRFERHEVAQQQQQLQRSISWGERVEKAITKHQAAGDDYAAVAFQPVPWASGSAIDQFIDGDDNGAEILYYLQSNPIERDAVLRLPALQQLKTLSLLSQRLDTASPPAAAAGVTGSVPRSNVRHLVPRPPNPVRTEAQRAEKTAAPLDGTLGIRAHAKSFVPR